MGRKQEGYRGECSVRHGENYGNFGMWLKYENKKCLIVDWKELVEVRNEKLKHDVEVMKNENNKREKADVYKNVSTWVTITKLMMDKRSIEKLACGEV